MYCAVMYSVESNGRKCTGRNGVCGSSQRSMRMLPIPAYKGTLLLSDISSPSLFCCCNNQLRIAFGNLAKTDMRFEKDNRITIMTSIYRLGEIV